MRFLFRSAVASAALWVPFSIAAQASAQAERGLDACGNIYVEARAECEVIPPSASCDLMCEPITVQAACAAELKVQCERLECKADIDVGCSASCTAGCEARCNVDPGEFDCQAYCQADCSGACDARCEAGERGAQCRASCQATCSGDCNAQCKIRPPSADCRASCKASCDGSCHAKANIDCQVDCQADAFIDCQARVTGGCKADCMTEEGALFCDAEYVDTGDNLQQCVDALKAALDVEVTYDANASGRCAGGRCVGSADASFSTSGGGCSTLPGTGAGASGLGLALLGLVGYVARRRRR